MFHNAVGFYRNVLLVFVLGELANTDTAANTTVELTSCRSGAASFNVSGATIGGIVYIRLVAAWCVRHITEPTAIYEFPFESCGITWETDSFKLVVQQDYFIQSGDDYQMQCTCNPNTEDLDVANFKENGEIDQIGLSFRVRPSGSMSLLKNGQNIAGQYVKLGEGITMDVSLDSEYTYDFDIKAKYCVASFISIIYDGCADDEELFPNFVKPKMGSLVSNFSVFRSTPLMGGSVQMIFSCVLQTCVGWCSKSLCSNITDGWGRRRRQATMAMKSSEVLVEAFLRVGLEDEDPMAPVSTDYCIKTPLFLTGLTVLCIILTSAMGITLALSTIYWHKHNSIVNFKKKLHQRKFCNIQSKPNDKILKTEDQNQPSPHPQKRTQDKKTTASSQNGHVPNISAQVCQQVARSSLRQSNSVEITGTAKQWIPKGTELGQRRPTQGTNMRKRSIDEKSIVIKPNRFNVVGHANGMSLQNRIFWLGSVNAGIKSPRLTQGEAQTGGRQPAYSTEKVQLPIEESLVSEKTRIPLNAPNNIKSSLQTTKPPKRLSWSESIERISDVDHKQAGTTNATPPIQRTNGQNRQMQE